jgi:hypothetical protein
VCVAARSIVERKKCVALKLRENERKKLKMSKEWKTKNKEGE